MISGVAHDRRSVRPCRRRRASRRKDCAGVLMKSIRVRGLIGLAHLAASPTRKIERIERDVHRLRPGQVDRRLVAVVAGVEHDHLVAGAHHRQHGVEDRLAAAAGDGDFGIRDPPAGRSNPASCRRWPGAARECRSSARTGSCRRASPWPVHRPGNPAAGNPGKPWPRLTAPCSAASCDITVKMVVPTFGSLVAICMVWRLSGWGDRDYADLDDLLHRLHGSIPRTCCAQPRSSPGFPRHHPARIGSMAAG